MYNGMFQWYGLTSPKIKAKYKNQREFLNWSIRLQNLCLSLFEWEGFPSTVDTQLLEWSLLVFGMCAVFRDPQLGVVCLPCAPNSNINIYGYPVTAYVYGANGVNKEIKVFVQGNEETNVDGVIIYDNYLRFPYINYVLDTAERLSDNIRSLDIAIKKLKNPYWIVCDNKQLPSVKKSLDQVDNNENAIITNSSLNPNTFQILNSSTNPNLITALWDNYDNTFDVFKEIIGINNNSQADKKERLLVDEINSNNETIDISLSTRLRQREKACEIIGRVFDFTPTVTAVKEKSADEYEAQGDDNSADFYTP